MAINWFEGGRRITKLVIAGTALIGGYVLFFEYDEPSLEFYTTSPLDEWHHRLPAEPSAPAGECFPSETLWGYEVEPRVFRDIHLCFAPGGKSEAEIVDEMAEDIDFDVAAARRQGYSDAEITEHLYSLSEIERNRNRLETIKRAAPGARIAGDLDAVSNLASESDRLSGIIYQSEQHASNIFESDYDFYHDGSLWWLSRIEYFEITPEMLSSVEQNSPQTDRRAMRGHVTSVVGTSAAFIASFWMFSFLIGWVVRGFAGIPRGQDFRPPQTVGAKA